MNKEGVVHDLYNQRSRRTTGKSGLTTVQQVAFHQMLRCKIIPHYKADDCVTSGFGTLYVGISILLR